MEIIEFKGDEEDESYIRPYKDLQLNRTVLLNEVLSVTEERGNLLLSKGLVEVIPEAKKKTSKRNSKKASK